MNKKPTNNYNFQYKLLEIIKFFFNVVSVVIIYTGIPQKECVIQIQNSNYTRSQ